MQVNGREAIISIDATKLFCIGCYWKDWNISRILYICLCNSKFAEIQIFKTRFVRARLSSSWRISVQKFKRHTALNQHWRVVWILSWTSQQSRSKSIGFIVGGQRRAIDRNPRTNIAGYGCLGSHEHNPETVVWHETRGSWTLTPYYRCAWGPRSSGRRNCSARSPRHGESHRVKRMAR